jgi:hypothetical protein
MKKIASLIFMVIIFSCSDPVDAKFCWSCETSTVITYLPTDPGLTPITSTTKQDVCELTEVEAQAREKAGSATSSTTVQGITIKTDITTKCTRK